jgi:acetyltransferase-like isoleucine patch superfamily enzyme
MKAKELIKAKLASFKFVRAVWAMAYLIQDDFRSGRFRGVLCIGLGNLLPDLLACSILRSILWRIAGAKFSNYSTTIIRAGVFTEYPSNLVAGINFQINRNSYLGTNGRIVIGDHVTISFNCNVITISHSGLYHEVDVVEPVIIKSHCLIYANCTILPGSILEEGVILAAGSVLKGTTEPWSIYAGVPARLVKLRNRLTESAQRQPTNV